VQNSINKVNIAFLGNQIAWGGGAKSLLYLVKSLNEHVGRIYVFVTHCSSKKMKKEFEKYAVFVKVINLPELVSAQTQTLESNTAILEDISRNIGYIEEFIEHLIKLNIRILHINNSVFSEIYELIKRKTDIKIISHVRELIHWNGIHDKQKFIIDQINNFSDAIICISDNESKYFYSNDNLYIVPNPFDFSEIKLLKENSSMKKLKNDGNIIVGMVGSFQPAKGILLLLEAIKFIKENNGPTNIKFVIVGKDLYSIRQVILSTILKILKIDNFRWEILKYILGNGIYDNIIFMRNTKNILEIINFFDIAVRPSLSGDPWGRDIIEYMSLKKAVVATGSSEFYIESGQNGYLVPLNNPRELGEKLLTLILNEELRSHLGVEAYRKVRKMCDYDTYHYKILNIYKSILTK